MTIYAKLNAARRDFHSLKLEKTGFNTFAKYKYFELADFLIPALQVFDKHGLCGVVSFGTDTAQLAIVDAENGSQIIITSPMSTAALKGCHEVQNLGAVQTYLRRYLWVAALEIVEHDAIDSSKPVTKPGEVQSFRDTPKEDAFNALQPEIQQFLRRAAQQVTDAMPDTGKAVEILLMALDEWPDEDTAQLKIGMWSLLDSKTRAAIKKHEQQRKEA